MYTVDKKSKENEKNDAHSQGLIIYVVLKKSDYGNIFRQLVSKKKVVLNNFY